MLDSTYLITTTGLILWSHTTIGTTTELLNRFIVATFLQSTAPEPAGKNVLDGFTFEWRRDALGFIAVACYQGILELEYVGELLSGILSRVQKAGVTVGATRIAEDIKATLDAWLEGFQKDTSAWESGVEGSWVIEDMSTGTESDFPMPAPKLSKSHLNPPSRKSRSQPRSSSKSKGKPKRGRNWDSANFSDSDSNANLDFSETPDAGTDNERPATPIDIPFNAGDLKGNDLPLPVGANIVANEGDGLIKRFFNMALGNRKFTQEEIHAAVEKIKADLLKKNVNESVATKMCAAVEKKLSENGGDVKRISPLVQSAVKATLQTILTPPSTFDLLSDIKANNTDQPYIISVIGVNGVGKSTSLAKLCFHLLQHKHKVLIAACDTFRSGAVEQLKAHVRNLKGIKIPGGGEVDIYEGGYGKDAALIAKRAVEHGAANGYDVILIDTAGRRHNDARLMSNLERFAELVRPNRIFLVAEALAGSDSIAQAQRFNESLGRRRNLDGFIVTKCDSVGEQIGTLVNMVSATGVPICFLGTGQNYGDLRRMEVDWVVRVLLLA